MYTKEQLKQANKKANKSLLIFGMSLAILVLSIVVVDAHTETDIIPATDDLTSIE